MEQKLVVEVAMYCRKCRTKALKIAAVAHGVTSVALEGERKEQLVVVGKGVDPICLVRALRKKVGHTQMLNFAPLSKKTDENTETEKPKTVPPAPTTCVCQVQRNWPPYVYPIIWKDPCSIL